MASKKAVQRRSPYDFKKDPLFRAKPIKFRQRIRSSEIDRFLYRTWQQLSPLKEIQKRIAGRLPQWPELEAEIDEIAEAEAAGQPYSRDGFKSRLPGLPVLILLWKQLQLQPGP